jgi:hypothetical protein
MGWVFFVGYQVLLMTAIFNANHAAASSTDG